MCASHYGGVSKLERYLQRLQLRVAVLAPRRRRRRGLQSPQPLLLRLAVRLLRRLQFVRVLLDAFRQPPRVQHLRQDQEWRVDLV